MALRPIAALDFDGVICNSARETAISAWRAGRTFWPQWNQPAPPADCVERFIQVRPYLETGFQATVMMRMVVDKLPDEAFRDDLLLWCDRWQERLGVTRQELVERFGEARDRWMHDDLEGWLASHEFYPGVVEKLAQAQTVLDVAILTTKQERFARALLAGVGITLADNRLFGLESGVSKEHTLEKFLQAEPSRPIHFVEDRAATLRRALDEPQLAAVNLYYASWGYGTPQDLTWASNHPRITVWRVEDFLRFS